MKQFIILLKKFQNQYVFYKKVHVLNFKFIAKLRKENYIINTNEPAYENFNKKEVLYFYDIDSNKQISFIQTNVISKSEIDSIMADDIMKQMTRSISDLQYGFKQWLPFFFLGLALGALCVYIYFSQQYSGVGM